jgi:hypothetical protein
MQSSIFSEIDFTTSDSFWGADCAVSEEDINYPSQRRPDNHDFGVASNKRISRALPDDTLLDLGISQTPAIFRKRKHQSLISSQQYFDLKAATINNAPIQSKKALDLLSSSMMHTKDASSGRKGLSTEDPRSNMLEDESGDSLSEPRASPLMNRSPFGVATDLRQSANDVFLSILQCITAKISKSKWINDLQEFVGEQMLSLDRFDVMRLHMDRALEYKGAHWIRNLSTMPSRPCWAIV